MSTRVALLSLIVLLASIEGCGAPRRGELPESTPVLTGYPVDSRPMTPDSVTTLKLWALVGATRELSGTSGKLPTSMEELLRFRRQTVHISPQPEWAIDGWGRPFLFSLHGRGKVLLLLSVGPDGQVGGGDDLFDVVRMSSSP